MQLHRVETEVWLLKLLCSNQNKRACWDTFIKNHGNIYLCWSKTLILRFMKSFTLSLELHLLEFSCLTHKDMIFFSQNRQMDFKKFKMCNFFKNRCKNVFKSILYSSNSCKIMETMKKLQKTEHISLNVA